MEKIYTDEVKRRYLVRFEDKEVFITTVAVVTTEAAMQKCREKMAPLGWKLSGKTAYMMFGDYPCTAVGYLVPKDVTNPVEVIASLF